MKKQKNRDKEKAKKKGKRAELYPNILKKEIIDLVWDIVEPLCTAEEMELVQVEFQHESGGTVLRLYIDKSGGISVDNCVNISRQASDLLDINLELDVPYKLEVSSPGIERPLAREKDFLRFKGKTAKIRIDQPLDGRKNFKGVLMGIKEGNVELMVDDKTIAIPYQKIAKARLVNHNGDDVCL